MHDLVIAVNVCEATCPVDNSAFITSENTTQNLQFVYQKVKICYSKILFAHPPPHK